MKANVPGYFDQTQWSTILRAQGGSEKALDGLLERYRQPILRHIRSVRRCDLAEAEDLAHEFILHWMKNNLLGNIAPERGRFRDYVKRCINNFLVSTYRRNSAGKRVPEGGMKSLDDTAAGPVAEELAAEAPDVDAAMDRAWARQVAANARDRLESECKVRQRHRLFLQLRGFLVSEGSSEAYAKAGLALGMNEGAVKTAVHRLRKRYAELLEEEVRSTVASEEDCQEERKYLLRILAEVGSDSES